MIDSFIQAIRKDCSDYNQLLLADWLEDNERPDDGNFIRGCININKKDIETLWTLGIKIGVIVWGVRVLPEDPMPKTLYVFNNKHCYQLMPKKWKTKINISRDWNFMKLNELDMTNIEGKSILRLLKRQILKNYAVIDIKLNINSILELDMLTMTGIRASGEPLR